MVPHEMQNKCVEIMIRTKRARFPLPKYWWLVRLIRLFRIHGQRNRAV